MRHITFFFTLAACSCVVLGCGGSSSNDAVEAAAMLDQLDASNEDAARTPDSAPASDDASANNQTGARDEEDPSVDAVQRIDFEPPTDLDELLTVYVRAYEAGDKTSIESLIYFGDANEVDRKITLQSLTRGAGEYRVVSSRRQPYTHDPSNPVEDLSIPSDQLGFFEFELTTPRGTSITFDWGAGVIDGTARLAAFCGNSR